jgi:PAS domain S-box-containing protein
MFISLSLPDHILFGASASVSQQTLPWGDLILKPGTGFTLWRVLKDLSMLLFVIFSFLILMSKLNEVSFSTIAALFAGLGIILLAAVSDQMIDLGYFRSIYFTPFALFAFYIVLSFTPMIIFLDESNRRKILLSQEKKMQDMLFQADLIVVSLNRMGIIEQVNPFFCKLTGFNEEEVIGKDWFEFFIPPKEYYNVQGAFVEILEYEFHPQFLNPVLTKDKEEIMIRWFNVRTLSQDGKITGSLSIGIDINDDFKEKADLQNRLKIAEELIERLKGMDKGANNA